MRFIFRMTRGEWCIGWFISKGGHGPPILKHRREAGAVKFCWPWGCRKNKIVELTGIFLEGDGRGTQPEVHAHAFVVPVFWSLAIIQRLQPQCQTKR